MADIIEDLNEKGEAFYDMKYAYVTTDKGKLTGAFRLHDLLFKSRMRLISDIMIINPHRVNVYTTFEELQEFFDQCDIFEAPVVDKAGCLLGVVQRSDIKETIGEQSNNTFLQSRGIVAGEELRGMPLFSRSFRRLSGYS